MGRSDVPSRFMIDLDETGALVESIRRGNWKASIGP